MRGALKHLRSTLYIPTRREIPSDATSASHQLLLRAGYIRRQRHTSGVYAMLPLFLRTLSKLESFVDRVLQDGCGAQKMSLPLVLPSELWRQTGRWESTGSELFRLRDRKGAEACLGPTHEEAFTDLLAGEGVVSHRGLPLLLYQTGRKYRDEARPRFGLLRAREFVMKDMYSFHANKQCAIRTYAQILELYRRIFDALDPGPHGGRCRYAVVEADSGNIGFSGSLTNEFHVLASLGEDELLSCSSCGFSANTEVAGYEFAAQKAGGGSLGCPACGSGTPLRSRRGIEAGQIFILGTKYSEALGLLCPQLKGDQRHAVYMGCYGIGLTRLLAAIVECCHDAKGIAWPEWVAPYRGVVLTSTLRRRRKTAGASAADNSVFNAAWKLFDDLNGFVPEQSHVRQCEAQFDCVLDDRWEESVGAKLTEAELIGYPWVFIVGKHFATDGYIETRHRPSGNVWLLPAEEIPAHINRIASG